MERAETLGISARVEWTGAVGQGKIPAYYENADVFCLPSFAEGVPTVLVEAMSVETPVMRLASSAYRSWSTTE